MLLLVGGLDPSGGAGLLADQRALAGAPIIVRAVATAATSQWESGVGDPGPVDADRIESQFAAVARDGKPAIVKAGLLPTPRAVAVLHRWIRRWHSPLVLDPVLSATSGPSLVADGTLEALRKLLPSCALVTPNLDEARALLPEAKKGWRPEDLADRLAKSGRNAVLVKGGHSPSGATTVDHLSVFIRREDDPELTRIAHPTLLGPRGRPKSARGTGCWLASRIALHLATGSAVPDAVSVAEEEHWDALAAAVDGGQLPPVPPLVPGAARSPGDASMVAESTLAIRRLVRILPRDLVPEVGSNLACVRMGARRPVDGLALAGRIVRGGGQGSGLPVIVGPLEWGGDHHTLRLALAAHKATPSIRAVLNLRHRTVYTEGARLEGFRLFEAKREDEPASVRRRGSGGTMEWLIGRARAAARSAPDLIWDSGAPGKEPMARLFAKDPGELVTMVERILERFATDDD